MGSFQEISGAKSGGESQKSPTETPDSLISVAYAKVLDAISEGPILGLANGDQSIFLNRTPLANPDGSLNFTGVTVGIRNGEADQDYLPGFPSVESETSVGIELKFAAPWVQTISNTELSAVRIRLAVPYLTYTDDKGNINGYEVDYAIDVATDSGAYVTVFDTSFNGKTTNTYERSHRINLPPSVAGWRVRVRRLTPDSTNSNIQSATNIASYTEIIDAKLRYPYTAIIGLTVDASQFSSIPSRAFDCKLRIVRVPSNYTPETRTYSGTWDGTFKLAWTDNPAWIYYDLILNDRYGLGQLITAAQVDKWGLYQIAGYCDELVDDGKGGTEPRFTCNLYLQTRADALQVLQDLASIFRGMAYWAAGSVVASADMPTDPVYTYTNANVIDGLFTYVGSARSTRFSVALVSWNDPTNFYEKKVEYVSDQKALARYGVQQTDLSAFGCTSQGQAQRLGHYTLLTNLLENETVSFAAGLDGTIARPGQIIRVADADRAGRRIGGRIKAATARTITLDADSNVAPGDSITVILPSGVAETKAVTSYANRVVRVGTSWASIPVAQSVFAIESTALAAQTFRVLSVAENFSDTEMKYDITAVKHVAGKFAAIDNGAQIVQLPVTVIPASVQSPPTNIRLSTFTAIDQGIAATTMRAEWDAPANAVSYDVWWRRNSNDWAYAGRTYSAGIEVGGVYAGTYLVRVAAVNALNASSIWAYSAPTELKGKEGLPPAVTSLTAASLIFGIKLKWTFPPGAEDTQRTEIWYGPTTDLAKATKLSDLAYPQSEHVMQGLLAGVTFFFWARLVDRTGNVGPWYPTGVGVMGQASSDAGAILEMIADQISETELAKNLLDRIDLIDGSGPGSVNERLDELKAEIGEITDALVYVPTDAYVRDNTVRVGDNLWTAIAAVPAAANGSNGPPNPAYWVNSGQSIRTANALAAQVTKNTTDITTVDGKTTATATQMQAVQAQYRADSGEGDLLDALRGWDSTASAAQEVKIRAEDDFAQAQRTTTLQARVGTNEARITTVETTTATDREATAQRITAIDSRVGASESKITTIESTANTDRQATAQQISTLSTSVGTTQAAIQTEATARSDGDTALGKRVDTVQATANNASAAVQTVSSAQATTDGKLTAMYTVKLQVNSNGQYVMAGIGAGIENVGGVLQSQILMSADRFALVNTLAGGAISTPFVAQNGQLFLGPTFIQDGTITNAKIGSYISSTNYIAGQSGWILSKDGTFEINSPLAGGGRQVINGQGGKVYDERGQLRYQWGNLAA
ncbi:phage tail protein [Pseudomonas syringae]|uniref:phage tail protein n=1 Tax=Pseudomonas syringae TaxID=317 RepID=UPI0018E5BA4B|nr:phage tail protein [Pseudomonas syringae]MBI6849025.1 phage tail protein [Pseudomonas syringae]